MASCAAEEEINPLSTGCVELYIFRMKICTTPTSDGEDSWPQDARPSYLEFRTLRFGYFARVRLAQPVSQGLRWSRLCSGVGLKDGFFVLTGWVRTDWK